MELLPDIYPTELYFHTSAPGVGDDLYNVHLHSQLMDERKKTSWGEDPDGQPYSRHYFNNRIQSASFSVPIFRPGSAIEAREVHLRYEVRFAESFPRAMVEGGKAPGFASAGMPYSGSYRPWPGEPDRGAKRGILYAGNGGDWVNGRNGWTARGGYFPRYRPAWNSPPELTEYVVPLHTYAYYLRRGSELYHEAYARAGGYVPWPGIKKYAHEDETVSPNISTTGANLRWGAAGQVKLRPGRWYRVDQILRINTPGGADGRLRAYIDGVQVGDIQDMCWRGSGPYKPPNSSLGIACAWFNWYQGGTTAYRNMVEETYLDQRRIAIKVIEWDEVPAVA